MPNTLGRIKKSGEHVDVVLLNSQAKKRGEIRIKPNRILWSRANSKGWRGIRLREFERFVEKNGRHQTK